MDAFIFHIIIHSLLWITVKKQGGGLVVKGPYLLFFNGHYLGELYLEHLFLIRVSSILFSFPYDSTQNVVNPNRDSNLIRHIVRD